MKNQRTPSDREVLTGLVERVTYAENGFCVIRVKSPGSSARTSIGRTSRQGQPNRRRPDSVEACAVDGSRVWTAEPEARGGLKYRLPVYHIFTHRSHQRIDIGRKMHGRFCRRNLVELRDTLRSMRRYPHCADMV